MEYIYPSLYMYDYPREISLAQLRISLCIDLYSCRNLEHSTILYEDPKQLPLLRLSWNKQDPNYLATLALESSEVNHHYLLVM